MVKESFAGPAILFYLASDANKNKRQDHLNLEEPVRVTSSTRINLEEPISSGYPAQLGLIRSSVRHSICKGQESGVEECKPY